jgi:hypothetical protein
MYTRNAQDFRKYFKENDARNDDKSVDIDFVSTFHPDPIRREKGFANLVYGTRKDIGGFLRSAALNVAADQQAIYELIQNADDCDSTFFSVNYNENYLLCINNGAYFSDSNMAAIINVGESDKEGEDIGTFGIGFKILHRLVGEDDGLNAIINDYSGPIIFSWNQFIHFKKFIENDEIFVTGLGKNRDLYEYEKDKQNPWLVKILYTCFPSHLGEHVRIKDFENQKVLFKKEELAEMRAFLSESLLNIDLQNGNYLKTGSIFFIKLGKGKHKFIEEGIKNLKSGISYSFNYLNSLKKIYINGEEIQKQKLDSYRKEFPIDSPEFIKINPRNIKRSIKFTFSYYFKYKDAVNISNTETEEYLPNFYNFFSMDEEKNGFRFLVHCNAFDMNNDRRKLQPDSQINERLLPIIASEIIQFFDKQRVENSRMYYSLYASFLLSKEPKNKPHINNYFFSFFKEYLLHNIPTESGFQDISSLVKIKETSLDISLADIGLNEFEWFYWKSNGDIILKNEAMSIEKLGLEKWNLRDIIENSNTNELNIWIFNQSIESYEKFLSELNNIYFREETKDKIKDLCIFKFSNNNFYSINDLSKYSDIVFNTDKTININSELERLGIVTSEKNISKYQTIYSAIQGSLPDDEMLFKQIAGFCVNNELNEKEKKNIFLNLTDQETKFTGIGKETLKDLELFCNSKREICPLKELISTSIDTPKWLNDYKIDPNEDFKELQTYLIKTDDLYQQIILPNWDEILEKVDDVQDFYSKVEYYYNLNENNTSLKSQNFIFINEENGFLSITDDVFYNSKLSALNQYTYFQSAVKSFGLSTPNKQILTYLSKPPFKIDESDILDWSFSKIELEINEIKSLINFCQLNNEQFFKHSIVEKTSNLFTVFKKDNDKFQISSPDAETRKFIDENCTDTLIVLPYELKEYNTEEGIIRNDDLHSQLLDCVNVDDFKVELVEIVKYKAKYDLLKKISEFRFVSGFGYTKEDFEYKILNLACLELKEKDFESFQEKVIIEKENKDELKLSEIPPFADKIQIDGEILSLAKILPNSYINSSFLSSVLDCFVDLGLPKEKLDELFGVKFNAEPKIVFELLSNEYEILENEQQLAFLFLYAYHIDQIDFSKFKALSVEDKVIDLQYDKYIFQFPFIKESETLHEKYKGVIDHIKEFPLKIDYADNLLLIKEPYFNDDLFICNNIKEILTDDEKISLIEFIYEKWVISNELIKKVNWKNITNYEKTITKDLLGFTPCLSVFPDKYAISEEQLPKYLCNWIGEDKNKINFIADLGVWVQGSTIVDLRKFYLNEVSFISNRIAQESIFNNEETNLLFTFEWLKSNELQLYSEEQFEVFKKTIEIINYNRKDAGKLILDILPNFELLSDKSEEWSELYYQQWKEKTNNKFSICLYLGKLPRIVQLDELSDYVFYRYNEGDVEFKDNIIYINSDTDIKKNLSSLVAEDNDFSAEDLLQLYQSRDSQVSDNTIIDELKSENERLRRRIEELESYSKRASYDATVTYDNDYHDEIKFKSESYLYKILCSKYDNVVWLNFDKEKDCFIESWENHDFEILDDDEKVIHYIDCKGTPKQKKTFYLTTNEWNFFLSCIDKGFNYQIYRVFNIESNTDFIEIDDLWKWIEEGKVVPYLTATETIAGGKVFLTLKL